MNKEAGYKKAMLSAGLKIYSSLQYKGMYKYETEREIAKTSVPPLTTISQDMNKLTAALIKGLFRFTNTGKAEDVLVSSDLYRRNSV